MRLKDTNKALNTPKETQMKKWKHVSRPKPPSNCFWLTQLNSRPSKRRLTHVSSLKFLKKIKRFGSICSFVFSGKFLTKFATKATPGLKRRSNSWPMVCYCKKWNRWVKDHEKEIRRFLKSKTSKRLIENFPNIEKHPNFRHHQISTPNCRNFSISQWQFSSSSAFSLWHQYSARS